jgi:RNA polymerase sigma-70 factor, ECF subfamily
MTEIGRCPRDADTDEALMTAYAAGDQGALEVMFRRHAPVLIQMARDALRSNAAAEQIVERTFLLLHRARSQFDGRSSLRQWLSTIASNCIRDLG